MKTKTLMLSLCLSVTLASCESQEEKQLKIKLQSAIEQRLLDSLVAVGVVKVEANTKEEVSEPKEEITDYTGTYKHENGLILTIKGPAKDGGIKYDFAIGSEQCIEQLDGTAYLTKPDFASADNEADGIFGGNFTFYPNGVTVKEYGTDIHGAHCADVNGDFKKIK